MEGQLRGGFGESHPQNPQNTTLAVVATDAALTRVQAQKLARHEAQLTIVDRQDHLGAAAQSELAANRGRNYA